jgi:hypothetical protein
MRQEWELDDLVTSWTLLRGDLELLDGKHDASQLGFALMLKFFEIEGRFPRHAGEIPPAALDYVARQLAVAPGARTRLVVAGRSVERYRAQIRDALGFRVFTRGDEDKMIAWLAEQVCPSELNADRQREAVLARCRVEHLEPPGRMDRIIGWANAAADRRFRATTVSRLSMQVTAALWAIVGGPPDGDQTGADEDQRSDDPITRDDAETGRAEGAVEQELVDGGDTFFSELKADPGKLGLETLLSEVAKLGRLGAVGLPEGLFDDVADRRIARWRARAMAEHPSTLRRDHPPEVSLTLLAVLCWCRQSELTDSLVDLFTDLVAAINTRAERRVDREQQAEFRRVADKESVLVKMADASLGNPDGVVRQVVFPAVGEQTLKDVVAEAKATESRRRARVRTVLTGSYSHYYRVMLPKLLDALEFRCNNSAYRPVMDAVDLLHRYKDRDGRATHYDRGETVRLDGVVKPEWRAAVADGQGRVERIPYELCTLVALREALRRREIWVAGARTWRNPETDLPADFDVNRDVHYAAIAQPADPSQFIEPLRARMDASLARLATAIADGTAGVKVGIRKNQVWISVSKTAAQPAPTNLDALKDEVVRRWGVVSLLDVLKEADWLTGFHTQFTSVATREHLPAAELRKRLLLVLFALGTNIGIKRIVHSGDHGVTEAQLRRIRRTFITRDGLRRAIAAVVGETLTGRDERWWGTGTACASDSKKFGSWESNLMTQWHARFRTRRDDLLARRTQERVRLLPAEDLLLLRGRRDDGGPDPARCRRRLPHHRQLHRYPRSQRGRVRVHAFAGLPAAAQVEEHRLRPAVPAGRRGDLPGSGTGPDPGDQLGSDHPAVRPDDQVCAGVAAGYRRGRADPAPLLRPWTEASDAGRDPGTRAGGAHRVHRRLPGRPRLAPGDPRGPAGGRAVELRERGHPLRP